MTILNKGAGTIWYGMHFYPGVAEYQEAGKDPYRVFLNEDTIRSMDPTFAAKPIFVEHVDEVDTNLDNLRKEADGWVVESFFNAADGKHWVKFIVVSERGESAIRSGMRLSNAYVPKSFKDGGLWNGVSYVREVTSGEYEHLAIVKNPRYEESVILTPEQFKKYNEEKVSELKKLSNHQDKQGEKKMGKFSFFKRAKVENGADLESLSVILPKTGKEVAVSKLINDADEMEDAMKKNEVMADPEHKVKMHDGSMCNVGELLEKHKAMQDELEDLKKKKEDEMEEVHGVKEEPAKIDVEGDLHNDEEDEKAKKKALELAEHESKEIEEDKKKNELEATKKAEARTKAEKLKNAPLNVVENKASQTVELLCDQVARGKSRYGSK